MRSTTQQTRQLKRRNKFSPTSFEKKTKTASYCFYMYIIYFWHNSVHIVSHEMQTENERNWENYNANKSRTYKLTTQERHQFTR